MNNIFDYGSSLRDQTVVVVGASSGMGLAICQACAALGARVVMASRSLEKLELARVTVKGQTEAVSVDMLDELSVNALFEQVGPFDHLVVTAVADEAKLRTKFVEMTTEIAQRSLEKFWGSFFCARAAVKFLKAGGSISLTSSVAIYDPPVNGGYAVTNAASAAVASLGRSLAAELKPIRVNVIAPGVVNTGVWADMSPQEVETFQRRMAETLPVGHLAEPAELAHAFLFLMTNPYTTGTVLVVDGGLMLT
jgi:NAD(P)-dependent dehydrogenase (short-subunit alcohol dehydrogenase family)